MGIIFKQEYTDLNNKKTIRDFHLDVEMIASNDLSSKIKLKCEHHNSDKTVSKISIDTSKLVHELLEGKRTGSPPWINLTRLNQKVTVGDTCIYIDPFPIAVGHPVAIASDLEGSNISYNMVRNNYGDRLELTLPIPHPYFNGAFVQDLSKGWWSGYEVLGQKSNLMSLSSVYFEPTNESGKINVIIMAPLNSGMILGYDVYVRNHHFHTIEPHWVPDANNVEVFADSVLISTFNGGTDSGGGKLVNGTYYVSLISKDKLSRYNCNESQYYVKVVNVIH